MYQCNLLTLCTEVLGLVSKNFGEKMQFLMSHFEGALLHDTHKREEKIEWNNKIGITKIHWEILTCFRILLLVK